ncbi:MAG: DeoR/GlpR transcriptional regulator [Verrucomicrobia bacterium]|nr:MAG: DeoR/GlpR transcriptional regulator [Verrucomicrobiota bacterium]
MQKDASEKALAPERLAQLRELVRARRVVRLQEICRELAISTATARRDLEELEKRGELRRVHGGAVSVESRLEEPLFDDKTAVAAREKQHIAEAALELIKPGETVYLDGGSTVLALARLLRDRTNLTVVTNSLRAASELGGAGPRLILVGGELRRLSQTVVGPLTRAVLEELHVDRAFMGTMGFGTEGLTTTDTGEAFTKELVMRRAREVVLLADSSKAGKILFARSGRLEQVNRLITDKRLAAEWAKELARRGVKVQKV